MALTEADRSVSGPVADQLRYDIVVPTVGRPSLALLLRRLAAGEGPMPERVMLVDDRSGADDGAPLLAAEAPLSLRERLVVLRSGGHGPAAARNAGWRAGDSPWVAFLDDDVVPGAHWRAALARDLATLPAMMGGCQARVVVPLPSHRRPTDWERNVAGLSDARWITADMAYRRSALNAVGGFDERFPRAYREDADLALRVQAAGYGLSVGQRVVVHPVLPAPWWVSMRSQAGNADDMLLRRRHGRDWRRLTAAGPGSAGRYTVTTAAALLAMAAFAVGGRRSTRIGSVALAVWTAATGGFAARRVGPGPRTPAEVASMIVTSGAIPPVAMWHCGRGWLRARRLLPARRPAAVLFDRDGTLIHDVPYNGDPRAVVPVYGARQALDRLRVAGVPTAVVSNQSGIARGLVAAEQVAAVNARVEELLGPMGPWLICHHQPDDGCSCRKPQPGLIHRAAARLGVDSADCTVIGDIGADVEAARRAGASAVLVPNAATRPEEIGAAPVVAADLGAAVDLLIGPRR